MVPGKEDLYSWQGAWEYQQQLARYSQKTKNNNQPTCMTNSTCFSGQKKKIKERINQGTQKKQQSTINLPGKQKKELTTEAAKRKKIINVPVQNPTPPGILMPPGKKRQW